MAALLLALLPATIGCGDDTPTAPSPPPVTLTGTWTGPIAVSGVSAVMTWTLAQNGTAISGPVHVDLPNGIVLMNGTLAGTLGGATLTYTITVPPGGLPMQPACAGQIGGTTTVVNTSTMNGSYSVTSSTCPTGFTTGTFTLNR